MRQRAIHCAKIVLCVGATLLFPCLTINAHAQGTSVLLRGFGQTHFEHVETTTNGEKESFDLFEPSVGVSAVGTLFSPRFLAYDAGVAFIRSDLDGTHMDLDLEDINYNGFFTFFPGRRLSIGLFGRKFRDELENNLFLLNRVRFEEFGARLTLLEGERLPEVLVGYLDRDLKTDTEFAGFDESGTEFRVDIDKRKSELSYHLGYLHTEFESNDFGYEVTSDIANFYASRYLTTNLFADVSGDYIRTKTDRDGPSIRVRTIPLPQTGRSLTFLAPRSQKETELRLAGGLHYRAHRFEGDGEYEYRRISGELFTRNEQMGLLSLTYLPSDRTTVNAEYGLLLSDSEVSDSSDQRFLARVSRRVRPNLVFYIAGDAEVSRTDGGGEFSAADRDFTVSDVTVGVDYNRPIGNFMAVTSLALGAGYASVSPGDSGARDEIEARASLGGTIFRRVNLDISGAFENRNDDSTFSFDERLIRGQVVATTNIGNRIQLRGMALALDLKEDGTRIFARPARLRQRFDLEIQQYAAEFGVSYRLARSIYGTVAVGRTSSTSNDLENDNNYLTASLNAQPIRNLQLVAIGRFQRGTQPRDLDDDQDYLDLQAIYRLRSWEFLLGYTVNKVDIGLTDLKQERTYLTVRRNFAWRLR